MTWTNTVTQTRVDLGQAVANALSMAEEYKTEAEAQHEKVKADPFYDEADRRASLSEVLLSHRVLALLRPIAEMVPAGDPDALPAVHTAHRVVHPPAPGWSRMQADLGALPDILSNVGVVRHFDLHRSDDGRRMHLFVDPTAPARRVFMACLWGVVDDGVETVGEESQSMTRIDEQANPLPSGEQVVVRFSRLPVPGGTLPPPRCGACGDMDTANCAVCG